MPFFLSIGGDLNIKNKYGDINKWFPIKSIKDGFICLENTVKLKLFKIEPVNFELKSEREQINILENYKNFLKNYAGDMQIIIQTDSVDLEEHIKSIEDFKMEKPELSDMVDDYIKLVKNTVKKRESISRKFYIVTKSKNEKVLKELQECGNSVSECDDKEIINVLKRYFNKATRDRKETKWV